MQQCPPPLPYSLPPVVHPRVSPNSGCRQSSTSALPLQLQSAFSGCRPFGTHTPLEAQLEKLGQQVEKLGQQVEKLGQQQLSLLEEIKNDINNMKRRLARLEAQHQEKEVTGGKLPEGFQFPLTSAEDVDHLERDLMTEPGKRTRLECHLAMRGGSTLKQVVKTMLSTLFSTELARNYNFNGLKGKRGLKNHPFLLQTIQDAARKSYPHATDADMQVHMSTWLSGARDRENGRRERADLSKSVHMHCSEMDHE
ncbi:uncharacterized protein LOC112569754 isoform X2 [Pomacea canaliculata]|nr:uncharacterized protein LOC112569754 isoform X2 [Pomacea canaliculata]